MESNRALIHMCASPNALAGDDFGAKTSVSCVTTTGSCSSDPLAGATMTLFSPFSPMDAQNQENMTRFVTRLAVNGDYEKVGRSTTKSLC